MRWTIAAFVGIGLMTAGTMVFAAVVGAERPSLQPLGTAAIVLIVVAVLFSMWRRVTVGNGYALLDVDALIVEAGVTVRIRIPYGEIAGVNLLPGSPGYWEGFLGFHAVSQAVRIGAGSDCVEVVLKSPHTASALPVPGVRFSRLWLGLRDQMSFVEALERFVARAGPTS